MKLSNIVGYILFVVGLIMSSYSFSRGVPVVGLMFTIVAIIGLLMNPPRKEVKA